MVGTLSRIFIWINANLARGQLNILNILFTLSSTCTQRCTAVQKQLFTDSLNDVLTVQHDGLGSKLPFGAITSVQSAAEGRRQHAGYLHHHLILEGGAAKAYPPHPGVQGRRCSCQDSPQDLRDADYAVIQAGRGSSVKARQP